MYCVVKTFFVYCRYQTGWFAVRRRNPEAENEVNEGQEQPQQPEAAPQDPGTEENTERAQVKPKSLFPVFASCQSMRTTGAFYWHFFSLFGAA